MSFLRQVVEEVERVISRGSVAVGDESDQAAIQDVVSTTVKADSARNGFKPVGSWLAERAA